MTKQAKNFLPVFVKNDCISESFPYLHSTFASISFLWKTVSTEIKLIEDYF